MTISFDEIGRRYTRAIRAVGIPLMLLEIYLSVYAQKSLTLEVVFRFVIDAVVVISMWYIVEALVMLFRKVFPTVKRLLRRALSTIVCGALAGFVLHFLGVEVLVNGVSDLNSIQFPVHMVFFSVTIVALYEVVFNLIELSRAEREREELQRSHLKSQLSTLTSQVNPHFLFNSLNTLLTLISSSPKKAEQFVEDLARVYRYLLQTNETEITTLEKELAFAEHYFQLLKTRYGNSISLEVNVNATYHKHYIPSLTLQLLIENAVKHNVITTGKPLRVEVFTSLGDYPLLNVRNNLQPKISNIPSTKLGLSNIIAKFNLLANRDIQVISESDFFLVSIPLLKEVHEHLRK